jgi:DNA-binding transcriptional ArsR family regulator
MDIDRKTLKALAADTRLDILKSLGKRRKMPSELSKEMGLASSTVIEHLSRLEEADLIQREETGHKWIYYSLTNKGSALVRPKVPMNFVIVLSLSILLIFAGVFYFSGHIYDDTAMFADAVKDNGQVPSLMQSGSERAYDISENITANDTNITEANLTVPVP